MKSEQTDSKTITMTETAASSNPTATPKKKRAAKKQAQTTIGRAEACDIGLFGDNLIEKLHARIVNRDGRYYLEDNETPDGTALNGELIDGPMLLRSGDRIEVGRCVLRFGERQRRAED